MFSKGVGRHLMRSSAHECREVMSKIIAVWVLLAFCSTIFQRNLPKKLFLDDTTADFFYCYVLITTYYEIIVIEMLYHDKTRMILFEYDFSFMRPYSFIRNLTHFAVGFKIIIGGAIKIFQTIVVFTIWLFTHTSKWCIPDFQ